MICVEVCGLKSESNHRSEQLYLLLYVLFEVKRISFTACTNSLPLLKRNGSVPFIQLIDKLQGYIRFHLTTQRSFM